MMQQRLWLSSVCFFGLLCILVATFVFRLWDLVGLNQDQDLPSDALVFVDVSDKCEYALSTEGCATNSEIDYSLLPDLRETATSKDFFVNLYRLGRIGKHADFQQVLSDLDAQQIMANLLFRKNELEHIKTVQIRANMLSFKQLTDAKAFAEKLILDLKKMHSDADCTQEQNSLIGLAMVRLIYLNRNITSEINKLMVMDPLLLRSIDPDNYQDNEVKPSHKPI